MLYFFKKTAYAVIILMFIFVFNQKVLAKPAYPAKSLKSLLQELIVNNPELKSLTLKVSAARDRINYKSYPDDPKLNIQLANIPTGNASLGRTPMSGIQLYFTQMLPFPTKLITKNKLAKSRFNQQQQVYLEKMNQLISKFKSIYYESVYLSEALSIHGRNKRRLTALVSILEARYSTGKVPQQDVLKTKLEITNIISQMTRLAHQKKIHNARLSTLLNRPANQTFRVKRSNKQFRSISRQQKQLIEMALTSRPWLKKAQYEIEAANKKHTLAKQELIPDFNFSLGYRYRNNVVGDPVNGEDFVSGGVGINLPFLWTLPKHHKKISEKKYLVKALEQQKVNLEQEVIFAVKNAYFQIKELKSQIHLYQRDVLPQAQSTVDSSMTSYEAGEVDYMSLISSQLSLFRYELDLVRYRYDHLKLITQLEVAVGRPL
ncbi:hypothetical protein BVY03_05925 [bacterium K02(2017)]|nr:hypothetical protein BVY03_05925 [bacterium K02(2017)]